MELDLDTFLVTLYCIVDDVYREELAPQRPVRPGPKPDLSDSEALCLAMLAQWQGRRSENAFVDSAVKHLRPSFPHLVSQSAFNRRCRDLCAALCRLGPAIEERAKRALGLPVSFEVTDGVPVPLMRRCRANQQRWFGPEAGIGVGGSDKEWFFGVRLLLLVTPAGFIAGWVEGPANTGERWLLEALFRWREHPEAEPPRTEELAGVLGPSHQKGGQRLGPTGVVETVNGRLEDMLGLWYPRAHSYWGLLTRLAAKVAAFNAAVSINYLTGRPPFALFDPLA